MGPERMVHSATAAIQRNRMTGPSGGPETNWATNMHEGKGDAGLLT